MRPRSAAWCAVASGAALLFLLWPASALAQEALSPSSFGNMSSNVKAGNVVIVTGTDGREIRGKVTSVSDTSLAILTRDSTGQWTTPGTFTPATVREVKRTGKIWDKAVLGFAIGAGIVVIGSASDSSDGGDVAGAVLGVGAMGAGIGLAFDAGFGPKRVYLAPTARKAGLTVRPILAPGRNGAALAYRF
jgi:hypothetical protein